ncbi:hypothetical protein LEN26_016082 [Aphanomyces euteiches]|nr:hypothetical protein LEN26_016082 [Aphanomyces euteiches]KAH9104803.1 hypothetical protein AeMF1_019252 [Aphanomyces euteiches]KAH9189742.1 hypothetical protein AeNC1_008282 [Aphanomyces euteiches]
MIRSTLLSMDILTSIVQWQHGLNHDMLPIARFPISSKPLTILDFTIVESCLKPWLATYGTSRLGLLFESLPHSQRLVVFYFVCSGQMQSLRSLKVKFNEVPEDLQAAAAAFGQLDLLIYLQKTMGNMSSSSMLAAATQGQLHIIQYLHDNGPRYYSISVLDTAAASGQLAIVHYLHKVQIYECTTAAMDGAATSGHLEIVKFLHANRTEGCTRAAINGAATMGHLEVVQWLHEHRTEGWGSEAVAGAAQNGHLDVLEFLHMTKPRVGSWMLAMDVAAINGHLKVVQFLHANRAEGCTSKAVDGARANGHADVLAYLTHHDDELIRRQCCVCGLIKPRNHACSAMKSFSKSRQGQIVASSSSYLS